MASNELITRLFGKGLGELLILHARQNDVCLGNIVLEKGRLIIRDQGLLKGFKPKQVEACWESGLLGMIVADRKGTWESLTYLGLEQCDLPLDLGKTRHGALTAAQNQYGDSLINFVGSVYRGYQLMLDNHFLPVVVLREVRSRNAEAGLAICDLRVVPMDLSVIRTINDVVRKSVEKQLILEVQDVEVVSEEFDKLFPGHAVPAPSPSRGSAKSSGPAAPARAVPRAAAPKVRAEAQRPGGADVITPVLQILKMAGETLGEARAFELFERWARDYFGSEAKRILADNPINGAGPRAFYDAARAHFEAMGEQFQIVEEDADHVLHEIRDCMYRQACTRAGGINMDKWGTCTQAMPTARNSVAAQVGGDLEWVWNRCDRRPGQPCLFDIRRRTAE